MDEIQTESLGKPSLANNIPDVALPQANAHSPEDQLAAFFKVSQAKLGNLIHGLSAKQMRRVLMFSASYPLIDPEKSNLSKDEKTVANVLYKLLEHKAGMIIVASYQKYEEAQNELKNDKEETETGEQIETKE